MSNPNDFTVVHSMEITEVIETSPVNQKIPIPANLIDRVCNALYYYERMVKNGEGNEKDLWKCHLYYLINELHKEYDSFGFDDSDLEILQEILIRLPILIKDLEIKPGFESDNRQLIADIRKWFFSFFRWFGTKAPCKNVSEFNPELKTDNAPINPIVLIIREDYLHLNSELLTIDEFALLNKTCLGNREKIELICEMLLKNVINVRNRYRRWVLRINNLLDRVDKGEKHILLDLTIAKINVEVNRLERLLTSIPQDIDEINISINELHQLFRRIGDIIYYESVWYKIRR